MTKPVHLSRVQCCLHKEHHPEDDFKTFSGTSSIKYLDFSYNCNPNKHFEMQQEQIAIIYVLGETLT